MSFRSDEDALIAKNEALEGELADAQRELHELRPQAERAASLERELADAQQELAAVRGPKPPWRTWALLLAGFLTVGAIVAGFVFFMLTTKEKRVEIAPPERVVVQPRAPEIVPPPPPPPLGPPYAELSGRVSAVDGPAPATEGSTCAVTLERARSMDARLRVECGGRIVYGRDGAGYLTGCTFRDEQPERCEDRGGTKENSDPMVILDRPTGTLIVSDGPELPWTVEIALDPPAAQE